MQWRGKLDQMIQDNFSIHMGYFFGGYELKEF